MKPIQWITIFFLFLIFGLLTMGVINFIIDPFQQYRKAELYKPIYDNERYLNPGLAKNYDYQEVIIGSSMTENFILSESTSFLGFSKPIKFCISGTTAYEMKTILDTAYHYKKIDSVLYGLDFFSFTGSTTRLFAGEGTTPFYLYDSNPWNDYRYLLSFDTFTFALDTYINSKMSKHAPRFDFNRMYQWQHNFSENDFNGLKHIKTWKNKNTLTKDYYSGNYSIEAMKKNFDINLLPIIKDHPETTFYIFYPPYSILVFKDFEKEDWLNTIQQFKIYVFTQLNNYPNVKIYDFQASKEVMCNLDNYKDLTHYHQRINTWMLEQIKEEKFLTHDLTSLQNSNNALLKNIQECTY